MHIYTRDFVHLQPDLPVIVRRDADYDRVTAPHTHEFVEIVIVYAGYGLHCQQDAAGNVLTNSIIKGDVFTVLPGEVHFYNDRENFDIYNICVDCDFINALTEDLQNLHHFQNFLAAGRPFQINQLHLMPMDFLHIESVLRQLMRCQHSTSATRELAFRTYFIQFMLELFDGMVSGRKKSSAIVDERLFALIENIEAHPEHKFDLPELAIKNGMSVSTLAHKFKDIIGIAPIEYCNQLRLERARKQLEETTLSLSEIAFANGFCDSNYLVRLFSKKYGISPAKYRKTIRH